jgi:hypothetical protein
MKTSRKISIVHSNRKEVIELLTYFFLLLFTITYRSKIEEDIYLELYFLRLKRTNKLSRYLTKR